MNQLDDFEKYLRDQLKGHAEPDPLMWKRLTDVIGRVEPWYAKSIFKYALTAIFSLTIGAVSTFIFFDQNSSAPKNSTKTSALKHHSDRRTDKASTQPILYSSIASPSRQLASSPYNQSTEVNAMLEANSGRNTPTASLNQDTEVYSTTSENTNALITTTLLPLQPKRINKQVLTLQPLQEVMPGTQRFGISIASGQLQQTLPIFNYQLGPDGQHSAQNTLAASPLLQFQFQVYKNWHLNLGVQMQKQTLTENFTQTDVYSYDEKEHFLFPYIYGFRQISDEELHEGPWPFGPNPPGGAEVSHVKASFASTLQTQRLQIPLSLSFHQNFGPIEAQFYTGLALQFNYNTQNTLSIPGYGTSTLLIQTPPNRFQTLAQSQVRLMYNANRHLGVFIAPQISASLSKEKYLHTSAARPQTRSIAAGLTWKF